MDMDLQVSHTQRIVDRLLGRMGNRFKHLIEPRIVQHIHAHRRILAFVQ